MRNRSIPRSTSTGHTASRNTAAKTSVPSDAWGATLLAAKATAKCPMNTSSSEQGFLQAAGDQVFAEPDPEQRAVEIFSGDGLALRFTVHHDARPGLRHPVERDDIALFRRPERVHDGDELGQTILQRLLLAGGRVVANAFVERAVNCLARRSRVRRMLMR